MKESLESFAAPMVFANWTGIQVTIDLAQPLSQYHTSWIRSVARPSSASAVRPRIDRTCSGSYAAFRNTSSDVYPKSRPGRRVPRSFEPRMTQPGVFDNPPTPTSVVEDETTSVVGEAEIFTEGTQASCLSEVQPDHFLYSLVLTRLAFSC